VRSVDYTGQVRAEMREAGLARGFSVEVVDGCLDAIARDVGRDYESLRLRPPDHPDRRIYQKKVEALGLVEAVCEDQGGDVLVIRLRVEAFV
jgi:hypothetical protein